MSEWATETDANEYLSSKPGTDAWFETGQDNQAYLTTAYRSINYNPDYSIPSDPTDEQLVLLQGAQIELAWFYYNQPDYDTRQALINQGVKRFKFSQWEEEYRDSKSINSGTTQYPAQVTAYLTSFLAAQTFTANVPRKLERYL